MHADRRRPVDAVGDVRHATGHNEIRRAGDPPLNCATHGADGAMLEEPEAPDMSERMIWDALDEGRDPTDRPRESDTEGR